MEQHPIPRQITSFEFKLIGFMTLKQFLYIIIFAPIGYIVYALFPIPLLNILFGIVVAALGPAFAFIPINDRPLDVWIRNFWKRLTSPTQYFYHKNNPPLSIFQNLYFVTDPHRIVAHIESQKMLSKYLASTKQVAVANMRKRQVQKTVSSPLNALRVSPPLKGARVAPQAPLYNAQVVSQPVGQVPVQTGQKKPFFTGEVKNNKHISLPGILIYVKNEQGTPVRLLKTNPHGIFATYNPLSAGEYVFEIKDPKNIYFFDTMKINITDQNTANIEIISKEML
ncbi:MAG: PrgI family protein [Patescibacteria group bacterium]